MNLERRVAGIVALGDLRDDIGLTRRGRERGEKVFVREEITDYAARLDGSRPADQAETRKAPSKPVAFSPR
jgi:hypothetical protein